MRIYSAVHSISRFYSCSCTKIANFAPKKQSIFRTKRVYSWYSYIEAFKIAHAHYTYLCFKTDSSRRPLLNILIFNYIIVMRANLNRLYLPFIPHFSSLYIIPKCHMLSKAFSETNEASIKLCKYTRL